LGAGGVVTTGGVAEAGVTDGRAGAGGIGLGGGIAIGFGDGIGFGAGLGVEVFGLADFAFATVFFAAGLLAFDFTGLVFAFGFALAFAALRFGTRALATFFAVLRAGFRAALLADFFAGFRAVFLAGFRAGFLAAFFARDGRAVAFLRGAALRGLPAFLGAFALFAFVFDDFFEAAFRGLANFAMALPHLLKGSIVPFGYSLSSAYPYRRWRTLSSIKVKRPPS
jgi:hypothetical protein